MRLSVWLLTVSKVFVVAAAAGEHRCVALTMRREPMRLDLAPEGSRLAADHRLGRGHIEVVRERYGETWRGRVAYRIDGQAVTFLSPALRRDPLHGELGNSPAKCGSPNTPSSRKASPRSHARTPVRPAPPQAVNPASPRPSVLASRILAVEPLRVRLAAGEWFADEARCETAARKPSARRFAWAALGLALQAPPEWIRDPSKDWLRHRIRAKGKVWFVVRRGQWKVCEGWQIQPDSSDANVAALIHSTHDGIVNHPCEWRRSMNLRHGGKVLELYGRGSWNVGSGCQGGGIGHCDFLRLSIHAMTPIHAQVGRVGWYFDRKTCLAARARETGRDSPATWHGAP